MGERFEGFPPGFFRFFRELAKHNERDWFNANKERYKVDVVAPMSRFIAAMDERLAAVSDCFLADPRPNGGSMFRIYRDVRFSHDKRPYKEHAACHFRHMAGKDAHAPGFYMHFEPGSVFFGGGVWMPPNPILTKIRQAIVDEPGRWKKATRGAAFKRRFGAVAGDSLKRPPAGFEADHPLIDDVKRKSFFAIQRADEKLAATPKLVVEVGNAFVALGPMMEFLTAALGLSFSLDA